MLNKILFFVLYPLLFVITNLIRLKNKEWK